METVGVIHVPQIAENPFYPDVTRYFQLRQGDFIALLNSPRAEDKALLRRRPFKTWFLESNGEALTEEVLRDIPNAAIDLARGNQEPAVHFLKKDLDRLAEDFSQDTDEAKRAFVAARVELALSALAGLVDGGQLEQQQKRFLHLGVILPANSL